MNNFESVMATLKQIKGLKSYVRSIGFKEYVHFGQLGTIDSYEMSDADVVMYAFETHGQAYCNDLGINILANKDVVVCGKNVGKSKLAYGKSQKDLTISMWCEDIGQMGVGCGELRNSYDAIFGEGWFDTNVYPRALDSMMENRQRELNDMNKIITRKTRKTFLETMHTRMVEFPSKMRIKFHFWKFDIMKRFS